MAIARRLVNCQNLFSCPRYMLGQKVMYVICETKCSKLTSNATSEVHNLFTTQEEADPHMLLHAKHAATVLIICLSLVQNFACRMYRYVHQMWCQGQRKIF